MIIFNQDKYQETTTSPDKPILHIDKIIFNSSDKNWVHRLFTASLTFKITGFDINDRELKSFQTPMTFGQFITTQLRQPVFEVNRLVIFRKDYGFHKDNKCDYWTTSIEVNNLTLQEDETLNVYLFDTEYIKKKCEHYQNRVNDWKQRISNLYMTIENWLQDNPEYKLTIGQPIQMYEELMESYRIPPEQIDTADLFKSNQLLLIFEPKGLWIIGANGGVDILSPKGSYILVDNAEQFKTPQWHLYSAKDRQKGIPFDKQTLLNIL